jgi:hypothetical protein
MTPQQVRDVFLEALAELSPTGEGGLFPHVGDQLAEAVEVSKVGGRVSVDPTALVEGALEAVAVLDGACAADHGVSVQVAARFFLDGLRATEEGLGAPYAGSATRR